MTPKASFQHLEQKAMPKDDKPKIRHVKKKKKKKKLAGCTIIFSHGALIGAMVVCWIMQFWPQACVNATKPMAYSTNAALRCWYYNGLFAVFHIVQSQVCQDIIFCISIHIKAWKYLKYKLHVNPCLSRKDMDPAKKSCFDNIELLDVLLFLSQD